MRYIDFEKASYNLNEREAKLEKVAERLIKIAAEDEAYGIGGKEDKVLFIQKPYDRKWGHYDECKKILPYNHTITEVYHVYPKINDLEISINDNFIYITSKSKNFRIGEDLIGKDNFIIGDAKLKEISRMVKYLLANGHEDLFVNKDHAEISFEKENNKKSFLNDFYKRNILFKKVSEEIFSNIIAYAKEKGLDLKEYNPDKKFGFGLINRKLILSDNQRWHCAENMEESQICIEYDANDLRLGFVNNHHNIQIDHYFNQDTIENQSYVDEISKKMAEIVIELIENGPVFKPTLI